MSAQSEHLSSETEVTLSSVVPRPRASNSPLVSLQGRAAASAAAADVADPTAVDPADLTAVDPADLTVVFDPAELTVADLIASAWLEFKGTGDRALRERLILHYAPLVASVAGRLGMRLPSSVEQADLVSYGMFGLIDAIEKYELDRSVKFETYASSRIRGAIIDELRAIDWIPRSVRTKARAVDRAYGELEGELRRTPSESEIAGRLEVGVSELRTVFAQLSNVNVAALDELLGAGAERTDKVSLLDTLEDHRIPDPAGSFEAQETKFLLARAIEQLGEREKIVLVLYYYEGMTLAEIGRVLGVTESRISQMHTAAMLRLRARLTDSERG